MTTGDVPENVGDLEDPDLLERSRAGDRSAFGELWKRHRDRALITAKTLAGSEGEDVVAESFTMIWTRLQDGRGPTGDFRPYLLATVRNLAAKSFKRSVRTVVGVSMDRETVEDGSRQIEDADTLRDIRIAFDELPERWQQVLWLSTVQERPRAEVASELQLSGNSTSQLLRRAKEGLRVAWLAQRIPGKEHFVHPEVIADLPRYVREAVNSRRHREIREHLAVCASCMAACGELRREDAALGAVSKVLASAGVALPLPAGGLLAVGHTLGAPTPAAAAPGAGALARNRSQDMRGLPKWMMLVGASVAAILLGAVTLWLIPGDDGSPSVPGAGVTSLRPPTEEEPSSAGGGSDGGDEVPPGDGPDLGEVRGDVATDGASARAASPTDPPSAERRPAISIAFVDRPSGRTAPLVTGTATPHRPVVVSVADHRVETSVSADGSWTFDLGSMELGPGAHSVTVQQTVGPRTLSSRPLTFSLTLPSAAATLRPAEQQSPDGPLVLSLTGHPGADVCVEFPGDARSLVTMSAAGSGKAVSRASADRGAMIEFAYCDGDRRGATGRAYLQ